MTLEHALNQKCYSNRLLHKNLIAKIFEDFELEKKDIGLKDINGNKIYADISIVQFEHIDFNLEHIECGRSFFQGFFKFNSDTLSYHIHYNNGGEIFNEIKYCPASFENFKIIDTIQENKLGLMK